MWLLEASAKLTMEKAQMEGFIPSVEQQLQFDAKYASAGPMLIDSRITTVSGGTANISVKGVLTQAPNFMAAIFGGGNTTYAEIISALVLADQDDEIDKINLKINSPGGEFSGLFDVIAAIQQTDKPVKAIITDLGASAAFAIAAQADTIEASNLAARIGSIGVVVEMPINKDSVSITSTDAPKKRPDVSTDEGIEMVREELDALHEIFVDSIAAGRDTSVKKVNADFGNGGILLANEALKRGMIDAVATPSLKVVKNVNTTTANSGTKPEATNMDLKQLQAEHPATFAAAVQQGKDEERDRVTAHLMMGEQSGDMKTACSSIKDGAGMTSTLTATYMTHAMNKRDITLRQEDDTSADAGDNVAAAEDETKTVVSGIFNLAAEACSVELEV